MSEKKLSEMVAEDPEAVVMSFAATGAVLGAAVAGLLGVIVGGALGMLYGCTVAYPVVLAP